MNSATNQNLINVAQIKMRYGYEKNRKNASRLKRYNAKTKARTRKKMYGRLFNGNAYAQGEFIFIWSLILAICVGMWLFLFYEYRPIRKDKCENIEVAISSFEIIDNGNDYIYMTLIAGDEEYKTAFVHRFNNYNDFENSKIIGKIAKIDIFKKVVVEMKIDEAVYVDFDDVNNIRADSRNSSWIFLILGGLWLMYVAVSWYVMYNAERFPRLIKIFVKSSYLNKDKLYKKR